jgi:hypothetical protein
MARRSSFIPFRKTNWKRIPAQTHTQLSLFGRCNDEKRLGFSEVSSRFDAMKRIISKVPPGLK